MNCILDILYSKGEHKITYKNIKKVMNGYKNNFYTNKNVERKLNKKLKDKKFKNLKI